MKRIETRQSGRHDVGHSEVTRDAWDWVTRGHSGALGALKGDRLQIRDVHRIDCDDATHPKTVAGITETRSELRRKTYHALLNLHRK